MKEISYVIACYASSNYFLKCSQHYIDQCYIVVLYKKALIIFFILIKKNEFKINRFEINFEIEVLIVPTIYTSTFDR